MNSILSYQPKKTEKAAIFLHGYGSCGEDLYSLLPDLKKALPNTAFYFPTAPEHTDEQGYQWFDLSDYTPSCFSLEYLDVLTKRALEKINIINQLIEYVQQENKLNSSQISLAGFSQGGLMAVLTALLRHDTVEKAVSLSGLPLYFGRYLKTQEVVSSPPLLFIQGTQDDIVPLKSLRLTKDGLKKAAVAARFEEIPAMGHEINADALFSLVSFLKESVKKE
jgi:phospholipase/carboxylesterase